MLPVLSKRPSFAKRAFARLNLVGMLQECNVGMGGDVRAEAGEVEETLWCASVIAFEVVEIMKGVAVDVASANIGVDGWELGF